MRSSHHSAQIPNPVPKHLFTDITSVKHEAIKVINIKV